MFSVLGKYDAAEIESRGALQWDGWDCLYVHPTDTPQSSVQYSYRIVVGNSFGFWDMPKWNPQTSVF